jgi:hypothetical protein
MLLNNNEKINVFVKIRNVTSAVNMEAAHCCMSLGTCYNMTLYQNAEG